MKYIIILFAQLCFVVVQGQHIPEEEILENIYLINSYNKMARPAPDKDYVVKVNHSLTLVRIVDMANNVLIADTWQMMKWKDVRLKWLKGDYEKVDEINIVDDEIWLPDVMLYNSAAIGSGRPYKSIRCVVKNNGEVMWVPPTRVTAQCSDLPPTDDPSGMTIAGDKLCSLKFGSWTYPKNKLDLVIDDVGLIMNDYNESPNFKIINSTVEKVDIKYTCCPDLYASIIYNLTLRPIYTGPQRDEPATPVEEEEQEVIDGDDVKNVEKIDDDVVDVHDNANDDDFNKDESDSAAADDGVIDDALVDDIDVIGDEMAGGDEVAGGDESPKVDEADDNGNLGDDINDDDEQPVDGLQSIPDELEDIDDHRPLIE